MNVRRFQRPPGFTLVELMVTLVIAVVLAAVTLGLITDVRTQSKEVGDLSRMRGLGVALHSWSTEHQGRFPRSSHSAFGHGELGWQREILPHLGYEDTSRATLVKAKVFGIVAEKGPARTPALNVYFELDPDYDDYEGAPKVWRSVGQVPRPQSTVLLIMAFGAADHVMAQYFSGKVDGFPAPRPGRDSGCVLWVDGHSTLERSEAVFDGAAGTDRFHPEKAR